VQYPSEAARQEALSSWRSLEVGTTEESEEGEAMTATATIAALEALTADMLKAADKPTLERLEALSERLADLIRDEKERRKPAVERGQTLSELMRESFSPQRTAARMAAHYARQATIREAIAHCASKPDLHARMRAAFPFTDETE
jgi:hypothetical protein